MPAETIILASTSKSRQAILSNAGVIFDSLAAGVDEDAVKDAFLGSENEQDLADVAMILAQAKAVTVSEQHPDRLVIGADQILLSDAEMFNKPESIEQARDQLLKLSGKTHALETAVACARNGEITWSYRESALLTMRALTPKYIGRYLAIVGADATTTVGGYKLEGIGVQLFSKIEGDYFAILGLPLLPVLNYLRGQGLIET